MNTRPRHVTKKNCFLSATDAGMNSSVSSLLTVRSCTAKYLPLSSNHSGLDSLKVPSRPPEPADGQHREHVSDQPQSELTGINSGSGASPRIGLDVYDRSGNFMRMTGE